MKLEIVLNGEKAKEHHYNIHKGYAKIEDFMIKQGFSKISEGVLEGDDSQKSFDSVLLINRELAKTKWFPLLVEKWWWHIDGEIEDCMGYITGVWEKKEEKPQIMRMEIVLSEEKAKLHGIDVNKGYKAIDDYFENPQKYIDNIPYYKKEIAKCTYRQFTTGFFFGPTTHDSQIYDNNTYVKGYEYLGTIHESLEDGRGVFEQKNKFSVGDEVEIMKPTGENIVTKVLSMQDEKGENVDSCPHPGQRITLQTECILQEYDIIRKEKEVSGDECEGGSACHS